MIMLLSKDAANRKAEPTSSAVVFADVRYSRVIFKHAVAVLIFICALYLECRREGRIMRKLSRVESFFVTLTVLLRCFALVFVQVTL